MPTSLARHPLRLELFVLEFISYHIPAFGLAARDIKDLKSSSNHAPRGRPKRYDWNTHSLPLKLLLLTPLTTYTDSTAADS